MKSVFSSYNVTLTGFLAYGLPVLILTKTAQAYIWSKNLRPKSEAKDGRN